MIYSYILVIIFFIKTTESAVCPQSNCALWNIYWKSARSNGTYYNNSQSVANPAFCKAHASDSCCDAAKLEEVKAMFNTYVDEELNGCKVLFNKTVSVVLQGLSAKKTLFEGTKANISQMEQSRNNNSLTDAQKQNITKHIDAFKKTGPELGKIKGIIKTVFANNIKLGKLLMRTYAGLVCGGLCDPSCFNNALTNNSGQLTLTVAEGYKTKVVNIYQSYFNSTDDMIKKYNDIQALFANFSSFQPNSSNSSMKSCLPACKGQVTTDCDALANNFTLRFIKGANANGSYCNIQYTYNATCPALNVSRILQSGPTVVYSASGQDPDAKGSEQGANETKAETVNGNNTQNLETQVNFGDPAPGSGCYGQRMIVIGAAIILSIALNS